MSNVYTQSGVNTSGIDDIRRGSDCAEQILSYATQQNKNEFAVILAKANKETIIQSEATWYDEDPFQPYTQVNLSGGYTAAATSIVVDDASFFVAGDVSKIARTAEQILVTASDTSTNTLTVTRGYGVTTAAAINDNDYIIVLGNASVEGGGIPVVKSKQPAKNTNVCQITKTPLTVSGTVAAEKLRAGVNERKRLQLEKAIEHLISIEHQALFNELKEDSDAERNVTKGILAQISTDNVYTVGDGSMSEADWDAYCAMLFGKSRGDKYFIAGPYVISLIHGFAKGNIMVSNGDTTYGLKLSYIQTPFGKVYLVTSFAPMFDLDPYKYMGIGLEMKYVTFCTLTGRDTQLFLDKGVGTTDSITDFYLTQWLVKVRMNKAHAILKNAQS